MNRKISIKVLFLMQFLGLAFVLTGMLNAWVKNDIAIFGWVAIGLGSGVLIVVPYMEFQSRAIHEIVDNRAILYQSFLWKLKSRLVRR